MKKNEKKLSKLEKDNLKFIVEGFLERDEDALLKDLKETSDKGKEYFSKLNSILSKGFHFPGDPDEEDKHGADYIKLTFDLHQLLKPVFLSLQQALLDFKLKIVPGRISSRKLISDVKSGKIDKNEPWYEYRDYTMYSPAEEKQFHDIIFDTKIMQHISFESGNITFHNNPTQQILNFLDLFKDIPISYFSRCAYEKCGKLIILTRSNKKHCKICAAKKHQAEKWKKDKEGMKEAERKRYHAKRKK